MTPAPQPVVGTVSDVTGSGTLYILITGSGNAIENISSVITVRACMNDSTCATANLQGSPQTINVTYHVAALQSSAASLDFTINNAPAITPDGRTVFIAGNNAVIVQPVP